MKVRVFRLHPSSFVIMWQHDWREKIWSALDREWDILIIGGGITGAGILREATRAGLRALLVEQHDFASGTSSRSGKMVHGGLRYLKNAQIKLTIESVRERDRLVREGRGLVTPNAFVLANFRGDNPPAWVFGAGLMIYDTIALKWQHQHLSAERARELVPELASRELIGAYRYFDAQTDDARLVLRVLREAVNAGGVALNYARVENLLREQSGDVAGAALRDVETGRTREIRARVVINATGAWADVLRARGDLQKQHLRKLRGSHLIFPFARLPLTRAVTFLHPRDKRPLYALPWEGVTLVGTTDHDEKNIETNPAITAQEIVYLMDAVKYVFPTQELTARDIQSTFAGLRPVVDTGNPDPSKESREFVLWEESGLLTVTGGKLTTFRLMAQDALNAARHRLPNMKRVIVPQRVLDRLPHDEMVRRAFSPQTRLRLMGRYGADTRAMLDAAREGELERIENLNALWAELRWAARAEGVVHLDDLLLRRVRLGLLLPRGGMDCLKKIRAIAQGELGWDDARWEREEKMYADLWTRCYAIPQ
jgi:glycerol-3-phosphate dehydrogenase